MSFQNKLTVKLDYQSMGSIVLNDVPLRGVRDISINASVGNIPVVTIEMYITDLDVEIDGEMEVDVELEEDEEVVKTA